MRTFDLHPSFAGAVVDAAELVVLRGRVRGPATPRELPQGWSPSVSGVLFRSAHAAGWPEGLSTGRPLSPELGRMLLRSGVRFVGTDADSIDPPEAGDDGCGHLLRQAGVRLLLGLELRRRPAGLYGFVLLPDGAGWLVVDPPQGSRMFATTPPVLTKR